MAIDKNKLDEKIKGNLIPYLEGLLSRLKVVNEKNPTQLQGFKKVHDQIQELFEEQVYVFANLQKNPSYQYQSTQGLINPIKAEIKKLTDILKTKSETLASQLKSAEAKVELDSFRVSWQVALNEFKKAVEKVPKLNLTKKKAIENYINDMESKLASLNFDPDNFKADSYPKTEDLIKQLSVHRNPLSSIIDGLKKFLSKILGGSFSPKPTTTMDKVGAKITELQGTLFSPENRQGSIETDSPKPGAAGGGNRRKGS